MVLPKLSRRTLITTTRLARLLVIIDQRRPRTGLTIRLRPTKAQR